MAAPHRFPVLPTVAMLAAVSLLIALGVWQIQRLHWKTGILTALDQAYRNDDVATLTYDDFMAAYRAHKLFLHGRVTGRFLSQWQIPVGPRTHDGKTGYHMYVPFQLDSGGTVLVNRGWVPQAWEGLKTADATISHNVITLKGLAHYPDRASFFTPPNSPDSNTWYAINLAQVRSHTGVKDVAPYILYADAEQGAPDVYPLGLQQDWRPDNNHLQYAIFWFAMAGIMIVIYWLRFILKTQKQL